MKYPNTYIAWDLETTGLDPHKDHIIEVGAVYVEGGVEKMEFSALLNHDIEIPDFITKLTGITKELIEENGREPDDVWKDFFEIFIPMADHTNLTHNGVNFDFGFLLVHAPEKYHDDIVLMRKRALDSAMMYKAQQLKQEQGDWESDWAFALRIGKIIAKGVFFSIDHCCKELGIKNGGGHRALHDSKMSSEIYQKLK